MKCITDLDGNILDWRDDTSSWPNLRSDRRVYFFPEATGEESHIDDVPDSRTSLEKRISAFRMRYSDEDISRANVLSDLGDTSLKDEQNAYMSELEQKYPDEV